MDFNPKHKFIQTQIGKHKKLLKNESSDISLAAILNSEKCQKIISECREFRARIYTPLTTILMFIKQVLSPDKSCKNTVAKVVAEHVALGKNVPSSNTGPYCKARERLPENSVKRLVNEIGGSLEKKSLNHWKWHNRNVKLVDGTTVTMPDTKENK